MFPSPLIISSFLLTLVDLASSSPLLPRTSPAATTTITSQNFNILPVVIWHGLGDRYDAEGLGQLKEALEERFDGIFVHMIGIEEDGKEDQRATFFGSAKSQISQVCSQLTSIPEISSPELNPSLRFDAIGFSQGGQLLRGVVESCTGSEEWRIVKEDGKHGNDGEVDDDALQSSTSLSVRNLITVGAQHMGVSSLPPCSSNLPFASLAFCRLMHFLAKGSIYSSYAQREILPAQYFRTDESEDGGLERYWENSGWLREINNERVGDLMVGEEESDGDSDSHGHGDEVEPRNETLKKNLMKLNNFVMFNFSTDHTVVPASSSFFTLPSSLLNSPIFSSTSSPHLPLPFLPLYSKDYLGLSSLKSSGRIFFDTCGGEHMHITNECWERVMKWVGEDGERKASEREEYDGLRGTWDGGFEEFEKWKETPRQGQKIGESASGTGNGLVIQNR